MSTVFVAVVTTLSVFTGIHQRDTPHLTMDACMEDLRVVASETWWRATGFCTKRVDGWAVCLRKPAELPDVSDTPIPNDENCK